MHNFKFICYDKRARIKWQERVTLTNWSDVYSVGTLVARTTKEKIIECVSLPNHRHICLYVDGRYIGSNPFYISNFLKYSLD